MSSSNCQPPQWATIELIIFHERTLKPTMTTMSGRIRSRQHPKSVVVVVLDLDSSRSRIVVVGEHDFVVMHSNHWLAGPQSHLI